jgi:hypothetical protein
VSASNWATCPRCLARAKKAEADHLAAVMATYGEVPVEEFDQARAAIEPVNVRSYATFREDYEIYGAPTGTVTVSYGGSCGVCGLALAFKDVRPIEGADQC